MQQLTTKLQPENGVDRSGRRSMMGAWARGVGIALGLVSIVYLAAVAVGDRLLVTASEGVSEVSFGQIFGMTILGASVGAVLALGLARWVSKPRASFLAVCALGLVGYGVVPFVAAETSATALWLNGFHLAVAVPVVWSLARRLPAARSSAGS